MFRSLIFKEWIKTRWFMLGYLGLACLGVALIFLSIHHEFTYAGAKTVWNSVLFKNVKYYASMKYIPIIGGLLLGLSQYFPETIDKRIKLLFHLPQRENKLLIQMLAYGSFVLSFCYTIIFTLFIVLSYIFFPKEMILDAIISMTPWLLAGYTAYFLVGLIVLEPVWKYRAYYSAISALLCTLYFNDAMTTAYKTIIMPLVIISLLLSIALLFSAYRFRKGEQ